MKKKRMRLVITVCISVMVMLMICLQGMNPMVRRSDMCYFDLYDLASPDTGDVLIQPELAEAIDELAITFSPDVARLKITSGYRTPEHNRKVGGASKSYHMRGMAIDCYCKGIEHKVLAEIALDGGDFTTAIVYKTHVHLDIREKGLGLRGAK